MRRSGIDAHLAQLRRLRPRGRVAAARLHDSVEHPEIAVPVTTPRLFFSDYEVGIPDEDTRRLELDDPAQTDIFVIVREASELADFTANLAAPVVLHTERRLGRQIMSDTRGYAVRHPLFSEVEFSDVQASTPRVPVAAEAV